MSQLKIEKQVAISTKNQVQPVWLTIANTCAAYNLGRTKLNELMNKRLVKFTRVKDSHQVRGRILINVQSMNELLESWATDAEPLTAEVQD